ncbi:MAG: DUF1385 domain-containing protein [Chloroflexota bacterium]|nr:DUF1385 domain-containing protein [Chloroflexota bacterium]MDP9471977.1 DUF1385 domain-containing protein [Chloroflexota bacterium]
MPEPVPSPVAYGGQAVLGGVMMRGRREMAVAVRAASGEILVWSEPLQSSRLARRVQRWPLVRGSVLLWDTMLLGVRALVFSSIVEMQANEAARRPAARRSAPPPGGITGASLWGMVAFSILCAIGLFFVTPMLVTAFLDRFITAAPVSVLVEGLIRLSLLLAYMGGIGYLPDVRRVFGFHGAEHKAVHAWEAGDPLDVPHVRQHPLEHPRCGTAFMLVVILLSMAFFLLLGRPDLPFRLASRILLVPVVAGVAYEVLKLGARYAAHPVWRVLLTPSLRLQRLTTREPDDGMLEVAIAALLRVLVADGRVAEDDPRLRTVRRVDPTGLPIPIPTPRPALEPRPVS